jgi:GWxTD domain-containing protein
MRNGLRGRLLLLLYLALLPELLAGAGQSAAEKGLPAKYRNWLALVAYHIQPVEKEVFLKLADERDRDIFVETFWKQRDPTPGTPANEYRDELQARFEHVNRQFGRGTTREGWRTDMGRIHMVLGPPAGVERFEATIGLVPCQAWSYRGDARRGLPSEFVLLFYQRGGVGEYRLYDPVSDGPARLLLNPRDAGDAFDYQALHARIAELSPTLAEAALTRIPGEYGHGFSPSPRNALLLADILESPKKDANTSYATHFLSYRGLVSTEYMTNFVESHAATALLEDPATGLRFFHFSMVPDEVGVDYYAPGGRYYCNFRVDVSLRSGEAVVFQYGREFPVYFPKDDWDRVKAGGLAIEESFPVAEGSYRIVVLLTNTVGKQFSLLERDLEVAPAGDSPGIEGPFVGTGYETYPRDLHVPFKVLDKKLVVDPRKTFAPDESIAVLFNVRNPPAEGAAKVSVRGLRERDPVRRTYTVKLDGPPDGRILSVPFVIPAGELEPDYYEVAVGLAGPGGEVFEANKDTFVVTAAAPVGHPFAHAKGVPAAGRYLYRYMLGEQYERTGRPEAARALYAEAHRLNPQYLDGAVRYGHFLNRTGAFDEALRIAEGLRDDGRQRFAYHVIRGQALLGRERYEAALDELLRANAIYDSDTAVLNSLGICYRKTGRKAEALGAFKASLKLDPGQAGVRKIVEELER